VVVPKKIICLLEIQSVYRPLRAMPISIPALIATSMQTRVLRSRTDGAPMQVKMIATALRLPLRYPSVIPASVDTNLTNQQRRFQSFRNMLNRLCVGKDAEMML
jgi:hypothetical protein